MATSPLTKRPRRPVRGLPSSWGGIRPPPSQPSELLQVETANLVSTKASNRHGSLTQASHTDLCTTRSKSGSFCYSPFGKMQKSKSLTQNLAVGRLPQTFHGLGCLLGDILNTAEEQEHRGPWGPGHWLSERYHGLCHGEGFSVL